MIARKNRFHGRAAVSRVKGSVVHTGLLSARFQVRHNASDYRLAVVVSKKVDSRAVVRNRIRRRIFESFRTQGRLVGRPLDIVVYVKRSDVARMAADEVQQEIAKLTQRILKT